MVSVAGMADSPEAVKLEVFWLAFHAKVVAIGEFLTEVVRPLYLYA